MEYILPSVIILILLFSVRKTSVYAVFTEGVGKGLDTVWGIFPAILAITTAVAMLEASGVLEWIFKAVSPVTAAMEIPQEVMPLALVRPLSGGAALGVLSDILNKAPPESLTALTAAVMMGSTETTFYTLCVYFRRTGVRYTKKIIPAALIGDIVGLIAAVWVCRIIF